MHPCTSVFFFPARAMPEFHYQTSNEITSVRSQCEEYDGPDHGRRRLLARRGEGGVHHARPRAPRLARRPGHRPRPRILGTVRDLAAELRPAVELGSPGLRVRGIVAPAIARRASWWGASARSCSMLMIRSPDRIPTLFSVRPEHCHPKHKRPDLVLPGTRSQQRTHGV